MRRSKTPVGILTGFLGSGKTTVLSRLLPRPEFSNAVVIINEFGEISIDHLIVANLSESIVELRNGCLCCTVRGDLVTTLRDLHRQRQLGEIKVFDRVLIETSGLADPVPLLHTLMTNPPLQKGYEIDTVVTVVDALNVQATLAAHHTAADQIAIADLLVISKRDLATAEQLEETERLVVSLNSQALRVTSASFDAVPQQLFGQLFGMDRFNPALRQEMVSNWLAHHADPAPAPHDHGYTQYVIQHPGLISLAGLTVFLNHAVNQQRASILRIKGIAGAREKGGRPVIIHAVQNKFYPLQWLSQWPDDDERCRLVFIGRDLDTHQLQERFDALCV